MLPRRIALFAEQGHFTAVHNLAFRVVMPQLSGSAWKVLCFLISETVGYNRRTELISYAAISAGTGLGSSATIAKALRELLSDEPFGSPLIVRQLTAKQGAASKESARYGLNLRCTVPLQKMKRAPASNSASISASKSEASVALETEASPSGPISSAGDLAETSNEISLSPRDAEPIRFCVPAPGDYETPHYFALCAVCELDPELISQQKKVNVAIRAGQLATKYSPEEMRLAGSRWPLPTAPHPDQFFDSIQALLARKESQPKDPQPKDPQPQDPQPQDPQPQDPQPQDPQPQDPQPQDPQPQSGKKHSAPPNEQQRNAAERREFMGELARRFK